MPTVRRASGRWGRMHPIAPGDVSLDSSGLGPFTVGPATSAENPPSQTSPMELLAAAYASCVGGMMALVLERMDHPADSLEIAADVEMDVRQGVTGIHLVVRGAVPGMAPDQFIALVRRVKDGCPVGKALAGTPTSLDVELATVSP